TAHGAPPAPRSGRVTSGARHGSVASLHGPVEAMHRAAGALHGTVGEVHGTAHAVQGSAAEPGDLPAGTPADVVERFAELCDLPLFRAVSAETMLHLAQRSETVAYQTGEVIVRQGEPGDSLYVIVHGRVDV